MIIMTLLIYIQRRLMRNEILIVREIFENIISKEFANSNLKRV